MSIDLKVLLDTDLGFPGIEIGSEQVAIDVFVQNISEYVGFASEQYLIRTRRFVELEASTLLQEEYFQKLDDVKNRAINELPQFYYRQTSMMLWTHFEWSMKRLLNYAMDKDPTLPPFSSRAHKLQAKTFCKSIKRYYKKIFKEINTLYRNHWQSLENFNIFRSNIAHSNGSIAGLDESKRKKILGAVNDNNNVKIRREYLVLSEAAVMEWHQFTVFSLQRFVDYYAARYPGAALFGAKYKNET